MLSRVQRLSGAAVHTKWFIVTLLGIKSDICSVGFLQSEGFIYFIHISACMCNKNISTVNDF